ncbi:MAG: hypothetical protein EAZ09_02705 [Oscillatoriales cyanobacterium]|nr:MAG: hypothetical protein EAZ09_02705 [Oscillatoriales cyanobacterium]
MYATPIYKRILFQFFIIIRNWELGIGHRASGIGHRAWGIGHRASIIGYLLVTGWLVVGSNNQ